MQQQQQQNLTQHQLQMQQQQQLQQMQFKLMDQLKQHENYDTLINTINDLDNLLNENKKFKFEIWQSVNDLSLKLNNIYDDSDASSLTTNTNDTNNKSSNVRRQQISSGANKNSNKKYTTPSKFKYSNQFESLEKSDKFKKFCQDNSNKYNKYGILNENKSINNSNNIKFQELKNENLKLKFLIIERKLYNKNLINLIYEYEEYLNNLIIKIKNYHKDLITNQSNNLSKNFDKINDLRVKMFTKFIEIILIFEKIKKLYEIINLINEILNFKNNYSVDQYEKKIRLLISSITELDSN